MTDHLSAFKAIREQATAPNVSEVKVKVSIKRNDDQTRFSIKQVFQKAWAFLLKVITFKANVLLIIGLMVGLYACAYQLFVFRYIDKETKWHNLPKRHGTTMSVEDSSIRIVSDRTIRYWAKFEIDNPLKLPKSERIIVDNKTVWGVEFYTQTNCDEKNTMDLDIVYRDKEGKSLTDTDSVPDTSPTFASPDSMMYDIVQYACSKAF